MQSPASRARRSPSTTCGASPPAAVRQFKGFGGRIEYVGARDLPLRAPIDAALRVAIPAYGFVQQARLRLAGQSSGEAAENA